MTDGAKGDDGRLTRGLGGSYPLAYHPLSRLDLLQDSWIAPASDEMMLMQSYHRSQWSDAGGYRSPTQQFDTSKVDALPDRFWNQIKERQAQFSDVHLYFHGLKGRHIATKTITVYGKKKGIAPGLQSKIERLWHGHLDRRESFSLILVDPQPTSAVPNGQVHLIIDLWPSLQALLYYLNGMLMMSRDVHCSRTACKLRFLSMKFFWRIPSREIWWME